MELQLFATLRGRAVMRGFWEPQSHISATAVIRTDDRKHMMSHTRHVQRESRTQPKARDRSITTVTILHLRLRLPADFVPPLESVLQTVSRGTHAVQSSTHHDCSPRVSAKHSGFTYRSELTRPHHELSEEIPAREVYVDWAKSLLRPITIRTG
jgi:hypothetical protein